VLTHDPKFDVPAIIGALDTDVGYLGVMGSRTTHDRRLARLAEEGLTDPDALARVRAPIGLDVGARTPEETAVAICAEIIADRTGREGRAVSGKVAQFGKATLGEVSTKLLGQFTDCLEHRVLGDDRDGPEAETAAEAAASTSTPASNAGSAEPETPSEPAERRDTSPNSPGATGAPAGPRRIDAPDADPIDLLDTAGAGAAARYVPLAGAAAVAFVLGWLLGRRR
jgi:hypothetical protein